ncbi:MAG TPA: hypothetical protein VKG45_11410 [Actinomycetes bacterium]|nr:hypothetical protein [Actinomycetes bacterium]
MDQAAPEAPALALGAGGFVLVAHVEGDEDPAAAADGALAAGASALQVDASRLTVRAPGTTGRLPLVAVLRRPGELPAAAGLLRIGAGAGDERLTPVARSARPVLLDADPGRSTRGWLEVAARLEEQGAGQVALCAPATGTGPVPHLGAVPLLRRASRRPLVVDATPAPVPDAAAALARAAAAAGADGVIVRLDQQAAGGGGLSPAAFAALARELDDLAAVLGRRLQRRRIRYVGAARRAG